MALAAGMVTFALEGGTYGTRDLLALKREVRQQNERIATLEREIDSLRTLRDKLTSDPATQERYARELYGMIREGERLYQVVGADRRP
ncbi:MAG TPA: septum formation initiator family protein [Gemmatimonadales bacterium]|nr:septum formation initiator family protein [Gemmatimonadales bacterium]